MEGHESHLALHIRRSDLVDEPRPLISRNSIDRWRTAIWLGKTAAMSTTQEWRLVHDLARSVQRMHRRQRSDVELKRVTERPGILVSAKWWRTTVHHTSIGGEIRSNRNCGACFRIDGQQHTDTMHWARFDRCQETRLGGRAQSGVSSTRSSSTESHLNVNEQHRPVESTRT